ncbi:MAG TPA: hypothetical protein VM008_08240 [Phycisphaerae bacterium]|nr:hypothetical protein [Phycisphaerae bacterium]
MTRNVLNAPARSGWRLSIAAIALAAAVVAGWGGGAGSLFAAAVSPQDHDAAVEAFQKARDLYQQQDYRAANTANDKALQLDPNLPDAQLLHKILQTKLTEAPVGPPVSGTASKPANGFNLLNSQQISMIRLQEIHENETNIHGRVPAKTLREYWDQYVKNQVGADLSQTDYNNFTNPLNFDAQVKKIRQANIPALSQTVEITSDPKDMTPFRNSIHSWVLQNCATAACHGGEKAGGFRLYRPPGQSNDSVIYTNFYILSMYTPADGGRLLDRDQPERSNLLQYALPRVIALKAHPGNMDVHKFGDANNIEYRNISNWIKGLAYPQPNYGIVYELPGSSGPAPDPATKPAMSPAPRPN